MEVNIVINAMLALYMIQWVLMGLKLLDGPENGGSKKDL